MNNLELREYVDEEAEKNPFLIKKQNCEGVCDFIEEFPGEYDLQNEIFKEISFLRLDDFEKEIVATLVNNVDGGYLNVDLLKYVSAEKKIDYFDLLKIVRKLKRTSFAHLFAFNLQDKLKTFLENEKLYDDNYKNFIENIDLAFSGNWTALKARCQGRDLSEMISKMKSAFVRVVGESASLHRRIDLIIEKESMDGFKAAMDESTAPEIEFDEKLRAESIKKCRSRLDKAYVQNNVLAAKLLVKSVGFRSSTLLKIANEIAYRQRDFFLGKNLIPVSVKSLARSMSLHESAVYRTISNKSISTPRGIFDLKALFPREIKSNEAGVSDYSLKEYVKKLIGNEPKNNPYSDSHIADLLNACGIVVSRRSVSKYRDGLDIPNVSQRSKIYKASPTLALKSSRVAYNYK
jgi:RNA polymerase sigma-54 factor